LPTASEKHLSHDSRAEPGKIPPLRVTDMGVFSTIGGSISGGLDKKV
jgi:hypothetical protein